ncbi:unnamed protein product [Rotaria sp. Silwood1]|nr:unnamed protein product [Rotaria sp. Silwood1]CAF1425125.1 unnamed protein product [Rotaria sp. Silwood1]
MKIPSIFKLRTTSRLCMLGKALSNTSSGKTETRLSSEFASSRFYSTRQFTSPTTTKKTTILDLKKKYKEKIPITMVTAYDHSSAYNVDMAGIDMILVGDTLGMVMLGRKHTASVTMDEMIYHCKAVTSTVQQSFVVGDMPFGSYETSPTEAVKNAIRFIKEGGVDAVKMEGGVRIKDAIKAIVDAGILVVGHIGLTPQTSTTVGGFKVQGKTVEAAQKVMDDALEVQQCGVSMIVIESVPAILARHITQEVTVPTIGIGAGVGCSGQVLVYHDMLGLLPLRIPKFCKQYSQLVDTIQQALVTFKREVENREFPTIQHSYTMKDEDFTNAFPFTKVLRDDK